MNCYAHIDASGFEKRCNFVQIGDFESMHCFESKVIELHVALYFASLAASVAEIRYVQSTKLRSVRICVICVF